MSRGNEVKGKEVRKVVGWSTNEMDEHKWPFGKRHGGVGWRGLKQEEVDECWKKIAVKFEEEVVNKYKVKTAKEKPTEERWEKCSDKEDTSASKMGRRLMGMNECSRGS